MRLNRDQLLLRLEGLHTVETAAEALQMKPQSALNLLSRLKKQGYVSVSGGGKRKRLYKITPYKQRSRHPGMFDIINKYSPHMKLQPWYDHQVHGPYGPEEALIDAVHTQSFRVILASLRLFSHITDWRKLYRLAKEKNCWQKIGALHDVARLFFRVKKMPARFAPLRERKKMYLIYPYKTTDALFATIQKKWRVYIPFRRNDLGKVMGTW